MRSEEEVRKEYEKYKKKKEEIFYKWLNRKFSYSYLRSISLISGVLLWVLSNDKKKLNYFLLKEGKL